MIDPRMTRKEMQAKRVHAEWKARQFAAIAARYERDAVTAFGLGLVRLAASCRDHATVNQQAADLCRAVAADYHAAIYGKGAV